MTYSGSFIHVICEICMAIGGLATFLTLIFLIIDSRQKSMQISTIRNIQSHQLESLYEPDIRISSWSNNIVGHNFVVINNHGENLELLGIYENSKTDLLNSEGMRNWFPRSFDKDEEIHIPLLNPLSSLRGGQILIIKSRSRLGVEYESTISIEKDKPIVENPKTLKKNNA